MDEVVDRITGQSEDSRGFQHFLLDGAVAPLIVRIK
jgi:hypothetical protein